MPTSLSRNVETIGKVIFVDFAVVYGPISTFGWDSDKMQPLIALSVAFVIWFTYYILHDLPSIRSQAGSMVEEVNQIKLELMLYEKEQAELQKKHELEFKTAELEYKLLENEAKSVWNFYEQATGYTDPYSKRKNVR